MLSLPRRIKHQSAVTASQRVHAPSPRYSYRRVGEDIPFAQDLVSWVAPDAVVQRAMWHSSSETKRIYQLGLVHQVGSNSSESMRSRTRALSWYSSVTMLL